MEQARSLNHRSSRDLNLRRLLAYVADLELEVDRLRRLNHHVFQEVRATLKHIQQLIVGATPAHSDSAVLADIDGTAKDLAQVLRDLHEVPGYHPAHDQVIAIAVRPLIEQVFRWQQRLLGAMEATCQLDLQSEYVEWFPARLRHILDNLVANALTHGRDDNVNASLCLQLRVSPEGYEFRVSDNRTGLESPPHDRAIDLFYRAAPARLAGVGIGLAVVKALVEQSGGSLTVDSSAGQGTTFVVVLPRFAVDDFLE